MTVESKYNLEDKLWVMYKNKPKEIQVKEIIIAQSTWKKELLVSYRCYNELYKEEELYTSKEELIASL